MASFTAIIVGQPPPEPLDPKDKLESEDWLDWLDWLDCDESEESLLVEDSDVELVEDVVDEAGQSLDELVLLEELEFDDS